MMSKMLGALLALLALVHATAATGWFRVRDCNVTMLRTGPSSVTVSGTMLAVTGRNLTFGLASNNFTVSHQLAKTRIDLADTHNTQVRVSFTTDTYYDAKVTVNFTEVGTADIKFSGKASVPAANNWPADKLVAIGATAYIELPWIDFKNKSTGEVNSNGLPIIKPYQVFLDRNGLGKPSKFDIIEGVFHSSINEFEAVVPTSSERKKSPAVPRDFVGFAMEWSNAAWFFRKPGTPRNALKINQNVVRALKNLRYLNVGVNGNSGMLVYLSTTKLSLNELDKWTGARKLLEIFPDDFRMLDKVGDETGASFIVGAPLLHPTDSRYLVEFMVDGILKYIKHNHIYAIEAGNEPDHWALDKKGFRTPPFTYEQYMAEMKRHSEAVAKAWPKSVPYQLGAGPAFAGCNTFKEKVCWQPKLLDFAQRSSKLFKYVTYHRYGNSGCSSSTNHETLLGDPDPNTGDFKWVEDLVPKLNAMGRKLVWGEGNALSCGGKEEVSDSFAATLWMLDNLFETAVRGVYKANVHTDPTHDYSPFQVDQKNGNVKVMPVFYGMLAFTRIFDSGSSSIFRLRSAVQSRYIKVWGVETASKHFHVVVLHKDLKAKGALKLRIKIDNANEYDTTATLTRLTAPSYTSKTGIKIAGQTFDGSKDGTLNGKRVVETVTMKGGYFVITVQPISAVNLFIARKGVSKTKVGFAGDHSVVDEVEGRVSGGPWAYQE